MKLSSKFKSYFIFFGAVIGFFVAIVFFNDFDSSGGDKAKLVVYGIGFGGLAGYFISSILLIFGQSGHFLINLKSATIIQYTIKGRFMSR